VTVEDSPSYRQIALDRLSSPEQLDQVLQVTQLRGWLALGALGALIVIALVWSVVGSIPTNVVAHGVLIRPGGLTQLYAAADGSVIEVPVHEGQIVARGEPIVRLDQSTLQRQIEELKAELSVFRDSVSSQAGTGRPTSENRADLERGAERKLAELVEQVNSATTVRSPFAGRVLEIKVGAGDVVNRGTPLVSLQLVDDEKSGLEAVVYVPAASGHNITAGMPVQISPASAAREEYGFLLGKVTAVSGFPATREGMMRVLANASLVDSLSSGGAPFAIQAELLPDSTSRSGYRWSSSKGSRATINSGTLCEVLIKVREERPIEMVLPLLRQASGL
jgi:multidrug efflux pump subunit AcrA (membrane-fusion protein)